MSSVRPRLLAASLGVAVVVSLAGGYVWAQVAADGDDTESDAVLDRPGVVPWPGGDLENELVEGDPLPTVDLSVESGDLISSTSLLDDGKPLVVNLWFSTCPPCRKELPDFAEVHAEVADEVRFVGVNPMDSWAVNERFATERGVEYELFLDDQQEFQRALGLLAFPATLFVTPDGTIVEQAGVLDADGLREKVDDLLELS